MRSEARVKKLLPDEYVFGQTSHDDQIVIAWQSASLPKPAQNPGHPPKLGPRECEQLIAIIKDFLTIAIDDIVYRFRKFSGISLSHATVIKNLREFGVVPVTRAGAQQVDGRGRRAGGDEGADEDGRGEGEQSDPKRAQEEAGARRRGAMSIKSEARGSEATPSKRKKKQVREG